MMASVRWRIGERRSNHPIAHALMIRRYSWEIDEI